MNEDFQEKERQRQYDLIEKHCRELGEHFDCVQIFCNTQVQDGTRHFSRGSGNIFSREGQVRDWIIKVDEQSRIETRDRPEN